MKNKPKVTWNDQENNDIPKWDLGIVDADNDQSLTEKVFYIWNNKAGKDPVADMENVTITTKTTGGNIDNPVVKGRWVKCRCDSAGETIFNEDSRIGAEEVQGKWIQKEKEISAEDSSMGAGVISGSPNTGDIDSVADKKNYSKITLCMKVPENAAAGPIDFLVRVYYSILE